LQAHPSRVRVTSVKAFLVDATYELFRAYYGGPPSLSPSGQEVGAVRTLARSLLSLLSDRDASHVACAFDHVIESFRNDLYEGYKTGDGIEPALHAQFGLAERVSLALGIVTWPMIEFEADDALATAARICAADERVEQVLLCSPDKDLAQCVVGTRIVLFDRMRKKILDEASVIEKFGVPPCAIPDYLALVGDAADGIPGIPGFGPKTAAALLGAHGSLDHIPADPAAYGAKVRGAERLSRELEAHRSHARLYRTLATLRTDVPLNATVDSLAWRGPDDGALTSLAAELGDDTLASRAATVFASREGPT